MSRGTDAGGAVNIDAHIACGRGLWLARVQAHPDAKCCIMGPVMNRDRALR